MIIPAISRTLQCNSCLSNLASKIFGYLSATWVQASLSQSSTFTFRSEKSWPIKYCSFIYRVQHYRKNESFVVISLIFFDLLLCFVPEWHSLFACFLSDMEVYIIKKYVYYWKCNLTLHGFTHLLYFMSYILMNIFKVKNCFCHVSIGMKYWCSTVVIASSES